MYLTSLFLIFLLSLISLISQHFYVYQATACALLAQFMSQTTHNDAGNEEKTNTPNKNNNNRNNTSPDNKMKKSSEHGFELEFVKNKPWNPTEKIVKMWIDVKGRTGISDSREADLGSELSVQRMRASVTADSLLVCFRHADTEYY